MVKEGVKIWNVIRLTRRHWRQIDIVDAKESVSEMDVDCHCFQMGVVQRRSVDWRIFNVVMDKDGETASPAISRAVATQKDVVFERRVGVMRSKFGFLKTGDFHVVFMEVDF